MFIIALLWWLSAFVVPPSFSAWVALYSSQNLFFSYPFICLVGNSSIVSFLCGCILTPAWCIAALLLPFIAPTRPSLIVLKFGCQISGLGFLCLSWSVGDIWLFSFCLVAGREPMIGLLMYWPSFDKVVSCDSDICECTLAGDTS